MAQFAHRATRDRVASWRECRRTGAVRSVPWPKALLLVRWGKPRVTALHHWEALPEYRVRILVLLASAIAAVAAACQKDREVFGIVDSLDPTFIIRITARVPRVVVGEDQRIAVESRLGSRCAAELQYAAGGNHIPSDINKADVGPETVPDSGVGVTELTWQV